MLSFKEYVSLLEYDLTDAGSITVTDEKGLRGKHNFEKHDLGELGGHRITHYSGKNKSYTFTTKGGATTSKIEHKKHQDGHLALSSISKSDPSAPSMSDTLHHMIHKGYKFQSDTMNTPSAHGMLMKLAKKPGVHTTIHDKEGKHIPHEGDITSPDNQKKYADSGVSDVQHHVLRFSKGE